MKRSMKHSGGPAFPLPESDYWQRQPGMTLLDYFAGQVAPAIYLRAYDAEATFDQILDAVGTESYKIAAAMTEAQYVFAKGNDFK